MVRLNTDVIFIDASGQVRARDGDLTLRANEAGGGDIIIGSGEALRPETDCRGPGRIDLGRDFLRWGTLYACSGNFIDRPHVNGSGVLLQGEAGGAAAGVDSVEGLTGVIDLDSPDESVIITVNGQTIELTVPLDSCSSGVFTAASGTQFVLEHGLNTEFFAWDMWRTDYDPIQIVIPVNVIPSGANHAIIELDNAIPGVIVFVCGGPQGQQGPQGEQGGVLAGVDSIQDLSGVVDLSSPDGTVFIGTAGQSITLTVLPDEGQTSVEGISGVIDVDSPDGTILINAAGQTLELTALPDAGQTSIEGLSGVIDVTSPDGTVLISTLAQDLGLVVLPDAGQTSVEGISGVIDLDSPDESININVNAQAIELTAPSGYAPSGASYLLAEYNDNDHLTDARVLSATSGVRLDDQGARSTSGIVIKLDFDDEPTVNQILSWNGQKLEWVNDATGGGGGGEDAGQTSVEGISGVINLDSPDASITIVVDGQTIELTTAGGGAVERFFTPESGTIFVVEHGFNSTAFVWSMWETHDSETGADLDPILSMVPRTVSPSGNDHAIINLDVAVSGVVTFVG